MSSSLINPKSIEFKAGVIIGLIVLGYGVGIFGLASIMVMTGGDSAYGLENSSGNLANVKDIPEELKPVFTAAGNKYQVSPAFVAAIFYKEHGENFPISGPWASSPAGANGPFQFIEKTWEGWNCGGNTNGIFETNPLKICSGYGQDGDGDWIADVQNLMDSGFAAAELLGANGAAPNVTDIETLKNVASLYNSGKPWSVGQGITETADYVPAVIEAYQRFISQI